MTQLPFGQIRPAAQPVNAFFQPGKANVAAATAQPSVPRMPQLGTQTQQGGFNVKGYNSFQELAQSLSVFSKEALKLGETLTRQYVSDQIKAGYEDEIKNESARAAVNIQNDLEEGAADAANEIGELQKVDPDAAQLLTDSNPYRLIGRRRAAAQLARRDVRTSVLGLLQQNPAELATLPPGHPRLTQMRSDVTRQIAQKYGLTGSEPEFIKYVVREINESWDMFANKQKKMYDDAIEFNTINLVVADVGQGLAQIIDAGVPIGNGQVLRPGNKKFYEKASGALTSIIDNHVRLLPPDARRRVIKNMQDELFGAFALDPFARQILQGIRGGNPTLPMNLRPSFGETSSFAQLQQTVAGTKARVELIELGNKKALQDFMQKSYYKPGGLRELAPTDPGYAEAREQARQELMNMGHTDPDEALNRLQKNAETRIEQTQPLDLGSLDERIAALSSMPLARFQGDLLQQLQAENQAYIDSLLTQKQKEEARNAFNQQINKSREKLNNLRNYINNPLQSNLLTVTSDPAVAEIINKKELTGLAELLRNGDDKALLQITEPKARQVIELIRRDLLSVGETTLLELPQDTPDSQKEGKVSAAMAKYFKTPEYKNHIDSLKPKPAPTPQVPAGPVVFNREQAAEITPSIAANYKKQPVLSGSWVRAEQQALSADENSYSEQLRKASADAKVTPARYLYEHIQRYYEQLDRDGSFRRFLRFQMLKQKQNDTVSFNQPGMSFDGQKVAYVPNDIAKPGGWLMNMLAGDLTPSDKELLRNYAETMRRNGSPEAIKEIQRLNIQYRQYGLAFPVA